MEDEITRQEEVHNMCYQFNQYVQYYLIDTPDGERWYNAVICEKNNHEIIPIEYGTHDRKYSYALFNRQPIKSNVAKKQIIYQLNNIHQQHEHIVIRMKIDDIS